jgi:hypothetical protein
MSRCRCCCASRHTDDLRYPTVPADLVGPTGIPGSLSADGSLTMAELRGQVLPLTTAPEIRDQVWRHVIDRVRAQVAADNRIRDPGYDWYLYTFGLAMPGLKSSAFDLAPKDSPHWWIKIVHRDIAAIFVFRLHTIDTDGERVISRLLRQTREATSHKGRGSAHIDEPDTTLVRLDDYLLWQPSPTTGVDD